MCYGIKFACVLLLGLSLAGCRPAVEGSLSRPDSSTAIDVAPQADAAVDESTDNDTWVARFNAEQDGLQNERMENPSPLPAAEFRSGHADPLEFDAEQIARTERGFEIQLPRKSPVPTPTIYRGKLYVSGGFSTEEYYCFDAESGEFVWGAKLDDDGPSSAVPYDDSIIFGSESCTLFALNATTGEMKWSHWLGDPLLSMPTVAGSSVFTVYPADAAIDDSPFESAEDQADAQTESSTQLASSHIAACFDAGTGELLWRSWVDSDCMSAPVAAHDEVYFASLAGTVYSFAQKDGQLLSTLPLRATSAPVVAGNKMIVTRRADEGEQIAECIAVQELRTGKAHLVAARQVAPYLDASIQRDAEYSRGAVEFESVNGIGGGFGGGFGFGGQQSVQDEIEGKLAESVDEGPNPQNDQVAIGDEPADADSDATLSSSDPLVATQRQAIENVGLGNVSTLQGFHGSRVLVWGDRIFSSMGDKLVAVSLTSGATLWQNDLPGDIAKTGGHLATVPIAAGEYLLIATVGGEIQQIDPSQGQIVQRYQVDGELRFPPIVDSGRIYVTTQDGRVICIATDDASLTGWPMWGRDAARSNTLN